MNTQLSVQAAANVQTWLSDNYDLTTKASIQDLQNKNNKELEDAFYTNLEFGTGGLRGLMGVGTNRMNIYTVGFTTQGFANYINKNFSSASVAIAHDSRNNSRLFAETAAQIFSANGIKVFLFEALRPTPELSFAIRQLKCQAGIVCTASHNPKEYNGYKAYWNDGAQIIGPHDTNILNEIKTITRVDDVKWKGNATLIEPLGVAMDKAYKDMVKENLCVNKAVIQKQADLKIVYTPIHGTGITLVPSLLEELGFKNVQVVKEQEHPDGNFPTVIYPNPEEKEAMQMGLNHAKKIDADILLGTDPDADRISIGTKNNNGEWILLNGNQTALIVFSYCIKALKEKGELTQPHFIVKTVVTTDLIDIVAKKNNVGCYNVLTGFKWIASLIAEKEGKEKFIAGGEESFGLLIGDKVRDKDGISAVAVICEMVAYYKNQNKTLFQALCDLYKEYGFYYESLLSITKKGKEGKQEIQALMTNFRNNIPSQICGIAVQESIDYESQTAYHHITKTSRKIEIPKSNVLQFVLVDGSKISFRPSGTEPKIKYYFSVNISVTDNFNYEEMAQKAETKIQAIIKDLSLAE